MIIMIMRIVCSFQMENNTKWCIISRLHTEVMEHFIDSVMSFHNKNDHYSSLLLSRSLKKVHL